MKHFASPGFWESYQKLPAQVRATADKNYALLKNDLQHPSLRLKRVGAYWSVRVGRGHRALATDVDGGLFGSARTRIMMNSSNSIATAHGNHHG